MSAEHPSTDTSDLQQIARQLSRLGDLFELYLYRTPGPTLAEMRAAQEDADSMPSLGKTVPVAMTDEELADAEWRELNGIERMDDEEEIPGAPI